MLKIFKPESRRIKFQVRFVNPGKNIFFGLFIGLASQMLSPIILFLNKDKYFSHIYEVIVSVLNTISGIGNGWPITITILVAYLCSSKKFKRKLLYFSMFILGYMLWYFWFNDNNLFYSQGDQFWFANKNHLGKILSLSTLMQILLSQMFVYVSLLTLKRMRLLFNRKMVDGVYIFIRNIWLKIYKKFTVEIVESLSVVDVPLSNLREIEEIRNHVNKKLFINFEESINKVSGMIKQYLKFENRNSSPVICIDGDWGSGKTSVVQIVKNTLFPAGNNFDINTGITWMTFKPWGFSNQDELIKSFFDELSSVLKNNYGRDLGGDLNKYIKLLTPVLEANGALKSVLDASKNLSLSDKKTHCELKESIRKKVFGIPGGIVIFIDDIDRLEYENIMLILKLVKENTDFPGLVFVLPFDYARVSRLIVEERRGADYYYSYLDKIFASKIKLDTLSYNELHGIYSNATRREISAKRLKRSLKKDVISNVFEYYVLENSRKLFSSVLSGDDRHKEQSIETKPSFDFYFELFNYFQPELEVSYSDKYKGMLNDAGEGLHLAISKHVSGEMQTMQQLVEYLYRPIKKIARQTLLPNLERELKKIISVSGVNMADAFINGLNPIFTDYVPQGKLRIKRLNSHIKTFWDENGELETANPALFDEISSAFKNILLFKTKEYVDKFEADWKNINVNDLNFVRNWLSKGITPRDVKLFIVSMCGEIDFEWGNQNSVREYLRNYLKDR